MKELKHKQQVKRTDDQYRPEIILHALIGSTTEEIARVGYVFSMGQDGEYYNETNVEKAVAASIFRAKRLGHSDPSAYCLQSSACLTSDYKGKAEAHELKRQRYENAVVIEDGEKVLIEGRVATVVYAGRNCSDCIHFRFED